MRLMAKFVTNAPRYRPIPPQAEHYFKLSERLARCSNIQLKLDVEAFDRVDNGLTQAIMLFTASSEATNSKNIIQTLERFSKELSTITNALDFIPSKYEMYPSLNDDIAFLIEKVLGREKLRECIKGLEVAKDGVARTLAKVTSTVPVKGRKDYVWYDVFVDTMRFAAEESDISLGVQDRVSPKLRTPFLGLVGAYEMCLPRGMRSPNREARAKRIETSLKRLERKKSAS